MSVVNRRGGPMCPPAGQEHNIYSHMCFLCAELNVRLSRKNGLYGNHGTRFPGGHTGPPLQNKSKCKNIRGKYNGKEAVYYS